MFTKKAVSLFASILVLLSVSSPAFAAGPTPSSQSAPIHLFYVYINSASSSLSISNGTATVNGYVQRTSSGKKITLESTLQQYSKGYWHAVKSWSASSTSYSASISKNYGVSSGTYRVATYYSVSGASGTESDTVYSRTVTC